MEVHAANGPSRARVSSATLTRQPAPDSGTCCATVATREEEKPSPPDFSFCARTPSALALPFNKKRAPERFLGIVLDATLQATSAIDGPAAVARSGSNGRRNGAIAFDGQRSRDRSRADYSYRVEAFATSSDSGRRGGPAAARLLAALWQAPAAKRRSAARI